MKDNCTFHLRPMLHNIDGVITPKTVIFTYGLRIREDGYMQKFLMLARIANTRMVIGYPNLDFPTAPGFLTKLQETISTHGVPKRTRYREKFHAKGIFNPTSCIIGSMNFCDSDWWEFVYHLKGHDAEGIYKQAKEVWSGSQTHLPKIEQAPDYAHILKRTEQCKR